MSHATQALNFMRVAPREARNVLNVGALHEDFDLQSCLPDAQIIGLDIEPGPGVDVVMDLTTRPRIEPLMPFDLIVCNSVLEHVSRPWDAAATLDGLLLTGGKIYISVPWEWRYHGYPEDYWRMTPPAVMALFPDTYDWVDIALATPSEIVLLRDSARPEVTEHRNAWGAAFKQLGKERRISVEMMGVKK